MCRDEMVCRRKEIWSHLTSCSSEWASASTCMMWRAVDLLSHDRSDHSWSVFWGCGLVIRDELMMLSATWEWELK